MLYVEPDFLNDLSVIDGLFTYTAPPAGVAGPRSLDMQQPDFGGVLNLIDNNVMPGLQGRLKRRPDALRAALQNPEGRKQAVLGQAYDEVLDHTWELTPRERLAAALEYVKLDREPPTAEVIANKLLQIPMLRQMGEGSKTAFALQADRHINEGTATPDDYILLAKLLNDHQEKQDAPFWSKVSNTLLDSIEFAGDFVASAGLSNAARAAAKKRIASLGLKGAMNTVVGEGAGVAASTAAELAHPAFYAPTANQILQRQLPTSKEEYFDEAGRLQADPSQREGWGESIARGIAQQAIENVTEKFGEAIVPALGAGKRFVGSMLPKAVTEFGDDVGRVASDFLRPLKKYTKPVVGALEKAQFHGIPAEMLEERAGDVLTRAIGNAPDFGPTGQIVSGIAGLATGQGITDDMKAAGEQLAVEATSFGLLPGAIGGAAIAVDQLGNLKNQNLRRRAYDAWKTGLYDARQSMWYGSLPVKDRADFDKDAIERFPELATPGATVSPERAGFPQTHLEPQVTGQPTAIVPETEEQRKHFDEFFGSPETAFIWTMNNPDLAQTLIDGRRTSAAAIARVDPTLPVIKGGEGDKEKRRQWAQWVKESLVAPPELLNIAKTQTGDSTELPTSEDPGQQWSLLPKGFQGALPPNVQTFKSPVGVWIRIQDPPATAIPRDENTPEGKALQQVLHVTPPITLPVGGQPDVVPAPQPTTKVPTNVQAPTIGPVQTQAPVPSPQVPIDQGPIVGAPSGGAPNVPAGIAPVLTPDRGPPIAGPTAPQAPQGPIAPQAQEVPQIPQGQIPAQDGNAQAGILAPPPQIDFSTMSEDDLAAFITQQLVQRVQQAQPQQSLQQSSAAPVAPPAGPQTLQQPVPPGGQLGLPGLEQVAQEVSARDSVITPTLSDLAAIQQQKISTRKTSIRDRSIQAPPEEFAETHRPILESVYKQVRSEVPNMAPEELADYKQAVLDQVWEQTQEVTDNDSPEYYGALQKFTSKAVDTASVLPPAPVAPQGVEQPAVQPTAPPATSPTELPGAVPSPFPQPQPVPPIEPQPVKKSLKTRNQGTALPAPVVTDQLPELAPTQSLTPEIADPNRIGEIHTTTGTISDMASGARAELDTAAQELKAFLKSRGLAVNPMLDPQLIGAVGKFAAKAVKAGVLTFADYVNELGKYLGHETVSKLSDAIEMAWDIMHQADVSKRLSPPGKVAEHLPPRGPTDGQPQEAQTETTPPSLEIRPTGSTPTISGAGTSGGNVPGVAGPSGDRGPDNQGPIAGPGETTGANAGIGPTGSAGTLVGSPEGDGGHPATDSGAPSSTGEVTGPLGQPNPKPVGPRSRPGRRGSKPSGPATGDVAATPNTGVGGPQQAPAVESGGATTAGPVQTEGAKPSGPGASGVKPAAGPRNVVITPETAMVPEGGAVTRAKSNIRAIQIMRDVIDKDRDATPAEQAELVQYVGWGALSQAFDEDNGETMLHAKAGDADYEQYRDHNWEKQWGRFYEQLKGSTPGKFEGGLLNEEEFKQAASSTEFAHYTSREVIGGMWKAVEKMGFKGGTVLEPAAGVGHFFGLMPPDLASSSNLVAVEKDTVSGNIAAALYPSADVRVAGLEDVKIKNHTVDLAITNVPFSKVGPYDGERRYGRPLSLHNYFLRRMIDAAVPGGMVVAITTHHTMDNDKENRQWMVDRVDLIGAIRLPNTAFKTNAGTEVVTDILFMRKRDGRPAPGQNWVDALPIQKVTFQIPGTNKTEDRDIIVNEYFAHHPEMVLGTHSLRGKMRGNPNDNKEYTLFPNTESSLEEQLAAAVDLLPDNVFGESAGNVGSIINDTQIKPNTLARQADGSIKLSTADDTWIDASALHPKLASPQGAKRIEAYVNLRDAYNSHIALSNSEEATDDDVARDRRKLNIFYDEFRKVAKSLNGIVGRYFEAESGYYKTSGLENSVVSLNREKDKVVKTVNYVKADVFTKRTMFPIRPPNTAANVADAVRISHSFYRRVDVPYIARLLGLDPAEVVSQMRLNNAAFQNPDSGLWEVKQLYLSGNVKEKLRVARIAAEDDGDYLRNVTALVEVQPTPKTASQVKTGMNIGARYIPEPVYNAFLQRVLGIENGRIEYAKDVSRWRLVGGDYGFVVSSAIRNQFATDRMTVPELLESSLNRSTIRITDPVQDAEGNISHPLNEKETTKALAKREAMIDAMQRFIQNDEQLMDQVVQKYNEDVNFFVKPNYEVPEEDFILPGSSPLVKFRGYQRSSMLRFITEGRGVVAHGVGSGKTMLAIGLAMEMRRMGIAKKPLLVAHNITVSQYATEFNRLYPGANVLVGTKADLAGGKRQRFLAKIASNDFDAVIVPASSFDLLNVAPQTVVEFFQAELATLTQAMRDREAEEGRSATVKQIQRRIRAIEAKIEKMLSKAKENTGELYFEDLNVDFLIIDEAHRYKKPPFFTQLGMDIKGIDQEYSARAVNALLKVRHVQAKPGNKGYRGVVMMTGTPITNTLAEAWHITRMAAPDVLRDYNIEAFDEFVSTFAKIEHVVTQDSRQEWVSKTYLSKFTNGDEFHSMLRASWEILTTRQLNEYFIKHEGQALPQLKGGSLQKVVVPLSDRVKKFNRFLVSAIEAYADLTGKDKRLWNFIPLVLYSLGKAAALDMRLVYGRKSAEDPGSKVNALIGEAVRIYTETQDTSGVQLIFSDLQNPFSTTALMSFITSEGLDVSDVEIHNLIGDRDEAQDKFLYEDIKKKLIAAGIPAGEIAIVTDKDNSSEVGRAALFSRVNSGAVRIVMGGTETLGTGANVQERAAAIHHLDIPYRPADLEQRLGRMQRFGNIYAKPAYLREIEALSYGMQDTMDASALGHIVRKSQMTIQALEGKTGIEFEDPFSEHTVTYADLQASLSGDPRPILRVQLKTEARRLAIDKELAEETVAHNKQSEALHKQSIEDARKRLEAIEKEIVKYAPLAQLEFAGTVEIGDPAGVRQRIQFSNDAGYKTLAEGPMNDHSKKMVTDMISGALPVKGYPEDPEYLLAQGTVGPLTFETFGGGILSTDPKTNAVSITPTVYTFIHDGKRQIYQGRAFTGHGLLKAIRDFPVSLEDQKKGNLENIERSTKQLAELEKKKGEVLWTEQNEEALVKARRELAAIEESLAKGTPYIPGQLAPETPEMHKAGISRLEGAPDTPWPRERAKRARRRRKKLGRKGVEDQQFPDTEAEQALGDDYDAMTMDHGFDQAKKAPKGGRPLPRLSLKTDPTQKFKRPIRADDIRKAWESTFGVPLRVGRHNFGQTIAGIHKTAADVVRTAEQHIVDLSVLAHEIGHHLDKENNLRSKFPNRVRAELEKLDYEPKDRDFEGWAEFVRLYITDEGAEVDAAVTHKWFETEFKADYPKAYGEMKRAREYAVQFRDQGTLARLRAFVRGTTPRSTYAAYDLGDNSQAWAMWRKEKERMFDRMYSKWVDQNWMLRKVAEEVRPFLTHKDDYTSPYEIKMFSDGIAPAQAEKAIEEGVHLITNDRTVIGNSLRSVMSYVHSEAEREEATQYALAVFHQDLSVSNPGYKTGMDQRDVEEIINRINTTPEKAERYRRFHKGLSEYNHSLLFMLADAGVMTTDEAHKMKDKYPRYLPLHRVHDDDPKSFGAGSRIVNLGPAVHRRTEKGSGRGIIDPVEATLRRTMRFYKRAWTQQVVLQMARDLDPRLGGAENFGRWMERVDPKKFPTMFPVEEILGGLVREGFVEADDARASILMTKIKNGDPIRRSDAQFIADYVGADITGMSDEDAQGAILALGNGIPDSMTLITIWRPDYSPSSGEKIVKVQIDGKPVLYQMDNDLYDTVTGMSQIELLGMRNLIRSVNKVVKLGAVGLSTGFGTLNMIRDPLTFHFQSRHTPLFSRIPASFYWMANYAISEVSRLTGIGTPSELIKLSKSTGLEIMTRLRYDAPSIIRTRRLLVARSKAETALVAIAHPIQSFGDVLQGLRSMISWSDVGPRLAEGVGVLKEHGYTIKSGKIYKGGKVAEVPQHVVIRMANAMSDATTNFRRAGTTGRYYDSFWPFLNAYIQSKDRQIRTFGDLEGLLSPTEMIPGMSTDKGKKARRLMIAILSAMATSFAYWMMRRGDDDYKEQDPNIGDKFWTFSYDGSPLIRIPKPFDWAVIFNVTEEVLKRFHGQSDDSTDAMLKRFAMDQLPRAGGVIKEVYEQLTGFDNFKNRPIEPEYLQGLEPWRRYTPYTTELAKATGELTGISPIRIEHALNATTGGMYGRVARSIQHAKSEWIDGQPGSIQLSDVPFVRGLTISHDMVKSINDFYGAKKIVDQRYKTENADDRLTPETKIRHKMFHDIEEMMTTIRAETYKHDDADSRWQFEKYVIGLARYALAREDVARYPNPMTMTPRQLPPAVRKAVDKFIKQKMTLAQGKGRPHIQPGETLKHAQERMKDWTDSRKDAISTIKTLNTLRSRKKSVASSP